MRKSSEGSGVDIYAVSEADLRSKLSKLRKEGANRVIGQMHGRAASLTGWNQVAVVTLSRI